MPAVRDFLAAVCADKADAAPRLIMADYLDEQGECGRAELIRIQMRLARVPLGPWRLVCGCEDSRLADRRCSHRTQKDDLLEREAELLAEFADVWAPPLPGVAFHWRRGFIASVTCTRAAWLAHEGRLFWHPGQDRPCPPTAQPVEVVRLRGRLAGLDLGRWPGVRWDVG